jgi:hypothetical protein
MSTAVKRYTRYEFERHRTVAVNQDLLGLPPGIPGPVIQLYPPQKNEFEIIDEQVEATYQEIFALIALRKDGTADKALEAQIAAKRQELEQQKKARAQAAQKILEAPSTLDEWRKDIEEAKQLLKEHYEAAADHSATNKGAEPKTQA